MFRRRSSAANAAANRVETLISRGTRIQGKVLAENPLRIDGEVEGEVQASGDVIVGESGLLRATVSAANLVVSGEVRGDVTVEGRMELLPSGRLYGNARVGRFVVAEGATFVGQTVMNGHDSPRKPLQGQPRAPQAAPASRAAGEPVAVDGRNPAP